MLHIKLNIVDKQGNDNIASVKIVRRDQHHRNKRAFWYEYEAEVVYPGKVALYDVLTYRGRVLHAYDNGAVRLAQKVLKAVMKQEKEAWNEK